MVAEVFSAMIQGIEGQIVKIQVDISNGLPNFNMIGYLSNEVKESKERVRTALNNIGILLPPKRISVNFAPADFRKCGTSFDIGVAAAILLAMNLVPETYIADTLFIGELSLNGQICPVSGVLPIVVAAEKRGMKRCIVAQENVAEAAFVEQMDVIGCRNLQELFSYLKHGYIMDVDSGEISENTGKILGNTEKVLKNSRNSTVQDVEKSKGILEGTQSLKNTVLVKDILENEEKAAESITDFSEVKGQVMAKRAMEIAAAGYHNLMLGGPPGVGKSMLASCISGIMPQMTTEEMIDTTIIYSAKGLLKDRFSLITKRPFRNPSLAVTQAGMFGGETTPQPGEISLAHHGILFLDEFPEHKREIIEMLRIPLEQHEISIVRKEQTLIFPADFLFIICANSCPCGSYPMERCHCTYRQIIKYQSKISGPILDRIDLFVRCEEVGYDTLTSDSKEESSADIRKRVIKAWEIQKERFAQSATLFNGRMSKNEVEIYCKLDEKGQNLMKEAFSMFQLTGRSYFKILKVARTIADLEGSDDIKSRHVEEALYFRQKEKGVLK